MFNKAKKTHILAIETSCDETAAAVLELQTPSPNPSRPASAKASAGKQERGKPAEFPLITTLSSIIKSQISIHKSFGGVVPEAAARAHVKNILPVTQKALSTAHCSLSTIDYIAVTAGPGLIPSLIVGVEFAKALAFATGKPLIPVNHMSGHLYSPFGQIKDKGLRIKDLFPMVSLIVSGGHTMVVVMQNAKEYKVIGQTVDDAAGEAFDKVAKLLKLPYPGGPVVSKLAEQAKNPVEFPRPMLHSKDYNFSFSGLKTAVLYFVKDKGLKIKDSSLQANICAGFQNAVVDVLIAKTVRAAKEYRARSVSLSGGVSANTLLRKKLAQECRRNKINFFVPPLRLSTDNAEMIGIAAAFGLQNGKRPVPLAKIKADPNLSL